MFERKTKVWFSILFIAMLVLPLLCTNLKPHQRSKSENRELAQKAVLFQDDGTLNVNYFTDFENWFNDNIGFRSDFVIQNAQIQYHVFHQLSDNDDYYIGKQGALAYATDDIIKDYQHFDLKSETEINSIVDSFQSVKDYVENNGARFYYFQCWDKQTIYPEYFLKHVRQYGTISKTEQFLSAVKEKTDVDVIDPKDQLVEAKKDCNTYSYWGDATHWTQRGAFLGYTLLMNEINRRNNNKYKILTESDYTITLTDQGATLFGGIHRKDTEENFELKSPQAYHTDEEPIYTSQWQSNSRTTFRNDSADNNNTLLVVGDSYFDSFIIDDLAESFRNTVMIWGDNNQYIAEMINYYHPAIVIYENAERCDRTGGIIEAANSIENLQED